MGQRKWELVAGLTAAMAFLSASGTQREHPLLAGRAAEVVRVTEASAAANPDDPDATRALAQAYLDVEQPGLALVALRGVASAKAADVRTRHLLARALLDEGRGGDALAIEEAVVAECLPLTEGDVAPAGCDRTLLASAVRRVGILRELATLGVSDVRAHPEASLIAYQNATREVRATIQ